MAQQATLVMTVVATGAGAKGRGVTWTGAQAGAAVAIVGIADHSFMIGDAVRVIVGASADAEAGAAIDGLETRLATDATGRLVPWTAGIVAARLVPKPGNLATAAGQFVEVVPIQS
jgi:hypothetical protein